MSLLERSNSRRKFAPIAEQVSIDRQHVTLPSNVIAQVKEIANSHGVAFGTVLEAAFNLADRGELGGEIKRCNNRRTLITLDNQRSKVQSY